MSSIHSMNYQLPLTRSSTTVDKAAASNKGDDNLNNKDQKLKAAASEFEALFVNQVLQQMRNSTMKSDILPDSEGETMFQSLLDEQYAEDIASNGDLGLANSIYEQMKGYL